jgi:hypothetical protein
MQLTHSFTSCLSKLCERVKNSLHILSPQSFTQLFAITMFFSSIVEEMLVSFKRHVSGTFFNWTWTYVCANISFSHYDLYEHKLYIYLQTHICVFYVHLSKPLVGSFMLMTIHCNRVKVFLYYISNKIGHCISCFRPPFLLHLHNSPIAIIL